MLISKRKTYSYMITTVGYNKILASDTPSIPNKQIYQIPGSKEYIGKYIL